MLSFKQYILEQQIIIEDRISFIKKQFPGNEHVVDFFATNADPTPNKIHTQWIMNQYKKGDIKHEDHERVQNALKHFGNPAVKRQLKAAGHPTDVNQYSLSSLESAIAPHIGAISGKQEKREAKIKGADLVHNDKQLGVTVHHIKTEQASCAYGANTKWCTSGEKDNQFKRHDKLGPVYVVQHQGKKYQFHTATAQLKDEQNQDVSFKDLHPDIAKSLGQSTHSEIAKANVMFGNPHAAADHLTKALSDSDSLLRQKAIQHPNVTAEHITKALNDDNWKVREAAIKHPNATSEHVSKALNDTDAKVVKAAIQHPKMSAEHITTALETGESLTRHTVMQHPAATAEHITTALADKNSSVRVIALRHPNVNAQHLEVASKSNDPSLRAAAMYHPKATMEQLKAGLKDPDPVVSDAAYTAHKRKIAAGEK